MSRENLRQLFLDFIDIGEDEDAWKINLGIYDDLLAEVKRLRERVKQLEGFLDLAELCMECGLNYAGWADYEVACKCSEGEEE